MRDLGIVDLQSLDDRLDELRDDPAVVRVRLEDLWDSVEVVESHGFRIGRRALESDGDPAAGTPVALTVEPRPWWQAHRC